MMSKKKKKKRINDDTRLSGLIDHGHCGGVIMRPLTISIIGESRLYAAMRLQNIREGEGREGR